MTAAEDPALAALVARLASAEARLARLESSSPIVGWTVAAEELGVSTDTVIRRRRDRGDTSRPWWSSRAALVEWWSDLLAPVAPEPPRARKPRTSGRVFDAAAMRRELRNR